MVMNIRYTVQLSDDERAQLAALVAAPGVVPQIRSDARRRANRRCTAIE